MRKALLTCAILCLAGGCATPPGSQSSGGPGLVETANTELKKLGETANAEVKKLGGFVTGIFSPAQRDFREAVKSGNTAVAVALYTANADAFKSDPGLRPDIDLLLARLRGSWAAEFAGQTQAVSEARSQRLYLKDAEEYSKLVDGLKRVRSTYLANAVLNDYRSSDEVFAAAVKELQIAEGEFSTNFEAIYRAFPHERKAFSRALPDSAGRESAMMRRNWDLFERKISQLQEPELVTLVENTRPAWSSDRELRAKMGHTVWSKIAPVDKGVIAKVHSVDAVKRYGLEGADVSYSPQFVLVDYTSGRGEMPLAPSSKFKKLRATEEATSLGKVAEGIVVVEIQELSAKRNIIDKQEVSSQYRSGSKSVPNAQYAIAQMNCQRAQSELAAQQARNTIAPARGWGVLIQGLAEGLTQANANKVCQDFAATPPTQEEDVFTSYTFTVSEIEVARTAKGRVVALDHLGNGESYVFNIESRGKTKVAYGMKAGDSASSRYSSDEELEKVASAPLQLDPDVVLQKIDLSTRTAHAPEQLPSVLAARSNYGDRTNLQVHVEGAARGAAATVVAQPVSHIPARGIGIDPASADPRMTSVVIVLNPKGSLGTGFYVDTNEILTNFHVVEGATTIELRGLDGDIFTGRVLRRDIGLDLALVRVERKGSPVQFANGILRAGDSVEAIGHPKGLYYSVTRGIVSAVRQRQIAQGGDRALLIQTDAAINPGNSGGPLFVKDKVVGVNTVKYKGADGVGFAVHFSEIVKFLSQ